MTKQNKVDKSTQKELELYSLLGSLYDSNTGKVLVETLAKQIAQTVNTLAMGYTTLSHIELIAHCASLKSDIDMINLLSASNENKEIVEEEVRKIMSATEE